MLEKTSIVHFSKISYYTFQGTVISCVHHGFIIMLGHPFLPIPKGPHTVRPPEQTRTVQAKLSVYGTFRQPVQAVGSALTNLSLTGWFRPASVRSGPFERVWAHEEALRPHFSVQISVTYCQYVCRTDHQLNHRRRAPVLDRFH